MENTQVFEAFLVLLRSGLWGTPASADCFPLTKTDWEELYDMSNKQTLLGIMYDGILTLPPELFPPRELVYRWTAIVSGIEVRNEEMNAEVGKLAFLFSQKGLRAILLKGQGVAACYTIPEHRICGDMDWNFPISGDFDGANKMIAASNKGLKFSPGFSAEYHWGKFYSEHHLRMVDVHSPFGNYYIKRLIHSELKGTNEMNMGGQRVEVPSPLLNCLCVNMHILKHFLSFGIGLRQLCDAARVYYTSVEEIDGVRLEKAYKKLGVMRWIQVLHQVLVDYLGLPEEYLPFPLKRKTDVSWMLNEVLIGGNFGFNDTRFGSAENYASGRRPKRYSQLFHRFVLNFRYAPTEAVFFPLVQFYSGILSKFKK